MYGDDKRMMAPRAAAKRHATETTRIAYRTRAGSGNARHTRHGKGQMSPNSIQRVHNALMDGGTYPPPEAVAVVAAARLQEQFAVPPAGT